MAALDGNQRPDSTGVGRGDQNLGHVADLVIVFIGDQVDAIVALLPPARAAAAPHPEIGTAADIVALRILARGAHLVAARFFRREGDRRFSVVIGGGCRGVDRHILRDPRPVGEAVLGLLADAVPAVLHKDDLERLIRHGAALPIDRQQIDGLGLAGLRDPVARPYADVVLALVDDGGGAIADVAPVEISNVGLEGEALAAQLLGDIRRHLEDGAPVLIRLRVALGDQLAVAAVGIRAVALPLEIAPTVARACLAGRALIIEVKIAAQYTFQWSWAFATGPPK